MSSQRKLSQEWSINRIGAACPGFRDLRHCGCSLLHKMRWSGFGLLVLICTANGFAAEATVTLRSQAKVADRVVRVAEVAEVSRATPALQQAIENLDLIAIDTDETAIEITEARLRIRLQLAGYSSDVVQVVGSESCRVNLIEPPVLSDLDLETAAHAMLVKWMGIDASQIDVRLSEAFIERLPEPFRREKGLEVEVSPPMANQLGTVAMIVRVLRGRDLVAARNVRFTVQRRFQVAVTRVSMKRGHVVTEGDVGFENRFLTDYADELTKDQVLGRVVAQQTGPGELLSMRNLNDPPSAESAIVVKSRDEVQVTAVNGGIRISLLKAQALQSGRIGDTIQVRNPFSREPLIGRITEAGHVEISLQ